MGLGTPAGRPISERGLSKRKYLAANPFSRHFLKELHSAWLSKATESPDLAGHSAASIVWHRKESRSRRAHRLANARMPSSRRNARWPLSNRKVWRGIYLKCPHPTNDFVHCYCVIMTRTPYNGTVRKLVLAFDIGTTYSGVAYAFLDPGQVPQINSVTK